MEIKGFRDILKVIGACAAAVVVGLLLISYGRHFLLKLLGSALALFGALAGVAFGGITAVVGSLTSVKDLFSWQRPVRAIIILVVSVAPGIAVLAFTGLL